jgi:hypothetical protein
VEVEVYLHPFLTSELYAFSFSFISPPLYHWYSVNGKLHERPSPSGPLRKILGLYLKLWEYAFFPYLCSYLFMIHPVIRRCIIYISGSFVKETMNCKLCWSLDILLGVPDLQCDTVIRWNLSKICYKHYCH